MFGAGTVQWSWGLDGDPRPRAARRRTRDAAGDRQPVRRHGRPAGTLQAGLVAATASTDTTAPTSTITSPVGGADGRPAAGHDHRHATDPAAAWSAASRCPSTAARPGTGRPAARAGPTPGRPAATGAGHDPDAAPSTTAATSRRRRRRHRDGRLRRRRPARARSGTTPSTPAGRRERRPARSSSASGSASDVDRLHHRRSASTRRRATPAPTSATCGRPAATRLGTATFTGETASGWQQVDLRHAGRDHREHDLRRLLPRAGGHYPSTDGYFAPAASTTPPLHALADGDDGANGVYRYGARAAFPDRDLQRENYWVDVVFDDRRGPDTTPPTVSAGRPGDRRHGRRHRRRTSPRRSARPWTPRRSTPRLELRDAGERARPGDRHLRRRRPARRPSTRPRRSPISATYTATVKGGPAGVKDIAGNALARPHLVVHDRRAAAAAARRGPGGPILVDRAARRTRSAATTPRSCAPRASTRSPSPTSRPSPPRRSPATTSSILGEMPLDAAQVTMFTDWVTAGGNLIAMRPGQAAGRPARADRRRQRRSRTAICSSTPPPAPGAGIVGETIQFHGTADRYTLNGAHRGRDAVLDRDHGDRQPGGDAAQRRRERRPGGRVHLRPGALDRLHPPGQPGVGGQERDGIAPIRSDDLFFGGAGDAADWVDLNKVAIPQADEQQRLLANLIVQMNRDRKPLPRFWYFPRGEKAVVVMTGDDHAQRRHGRPLRPVQRRAARPAARSTTGSASAPRPTSIPNTPLTDAQAAAYKAAGLRDRAARQHGLRQLDARARSRPIYANQLGAVRRAATRASRRRRPTARTASSGATGRPSRRSSSTTASGSTRTTTTGRGAGSQDRPGHVHRLRHADALRRPDGTMIDVYQAATQMTDESGQTYPFTSTRCSTRRSAPQGYYGVVHREHAHRQRLARRAPTRSSPRRRRAACRSSRPGRCSTGSTAATARRSAR